MDAPVHPVSAWIRVSDENRDVVSSRSHERGQSGGFFLVGINPNIFGSPQSGDDVVVVLEFRCRNGRAFFSSLYDSAIVKSSLLLKDANNDCPSSFFEVISLSSFSVRGIQTVGFLLELQLHPFRQILLVQGLPSRILVGDVLEDVAKENPAILRLGDSRYVRPIEAFSILGGYQG